MCGQLINERDAGTLSVPHTNFRGTCPKSVPDSSFTLKAFHNIAWGQRRSRATPGEDHNGTEP